mgnify:CR=1 FL=1
MTRLESNSHFLIFGSGSNTELLELLQVVDGRPLEEGRGEMMIGRAASEWLGIGPGDRVCIGGAAKRDFLAAVLACFGIGALPVSLVDEDEPPLSYLALCCDLGLDPQTYAVMQVPHLPQTVAALGGGETTTILLPRPIPVLMLYGTAVPEGFVFSEAGLQMPPADRQDVAVAVDPESERLALLAALVTIYGISLLATIVIALVIHRGGLILGVVGGALLGLARALEELDLRHEDLVLPVGEFPVTGHHVHPEAVAGADHVLAAGPVGGAGALPGVAAVEQQTVAVAALGAQAVDQGLEVGEAADHAVFGGGFVEVQI